MGRFTINTETFMDLLSKITKLSGSVSLQAENAYYYHVLLATLHDSFLFDRIVLYRVLNHVESTLIIEAASIFEAVGPGHDLEQGERIEIDLERPGNDFFNEAQAFTAKGVSFRNDRKNGGWMSGYVQIPQCLGFSYLISGTCESRKTSFTKEDARMFEFVCIAAGSFFLKTCHGFQAVSDALTGLYTRPQTAGIIEDRLKRFDRLDSFNSCLVRCDIDHLRKVNRRFGYIQGDQVLREIGTLFSASVRQGMDMIGRYAGDEFVLFLEAVDADTALSTVERLRKRIEQNRFQRVDEKGGGINGQYLHITASFGIAEHNPVSGIFDITQWISRADSALYRSKEKGGNIATVWKEPGEVIVP